MRITTSLSDNKVPGMWQQFMPRRQEIKNRIGNGYYSVSIYESGLKISQFTPKTIFQKWATVEVTGFDIVPEGMEKTPALRRTICCVHL